MSRTDSGLRIRRVPNCSVHHRLQIRRDVFGVVIMAVLIESQVERQLVVQPDASQVHAGRMKGPTVLSQPTLASSSPVMEL